MPRLESMGDEGTETDSNETMSTTDRPLWSGMLTFGLVSVPVDLLPATRNASVGMRVLGRAGEQLERHYYCPAHDVDVPKEHIVRGYKTQAAQYVPVTDEELDALDPEKSREIYLQLFVPIASVAPLYLEHPYLLVPSTDSGKAFALLTQALELRGYAGVATFVMRDREHWVATFAAGGLLRAETLHFSGYVRLARDVGFAPFEKPERARIEAMERAVVALRADSLPTAELEDEHGAAVARLAQRKASEGKDVVQANEPTPTTTQDNVINLMEVLKQRFAEAGFNTDASAEDDAQGVAASHKRTPPVGDTSARATSGKRIAAAIGTYKAEPRAQSTGRTAKKARSKGA